MKRFTDPDNLQAAAYPTIVEADLTMPRLN